MKRTTRAAITLCFFADGLLLGSWAARIPAVQAQAGMSNAQLGIALFASSLGALVAMPVAGRVSEVAGSGRVTVGGLLLAALALAGASQANAALQVGIALLVFGAGFGAINVAANAQGIAFERIRGRAILSSFHAAFSAGGLAGAGSGALLAGAGVTPGVHVGVLAVVVAVAASVLGRELLPRQACDAAPQRVLVRPPRRLLLLGAAAFCTLLAEGSAADWSAVYLSQSVATTAAIAGLGYTAFSLAMTASRLAGDRLQRRLGPVALARAGGLVAACGLTAGLLSGSAVPALVGFAAMGAGLGVVVPILFRAAGTQPGVSESVGVAAVSTIGWLGFLAGPPAIGLAASAIGLRAALGIVVGATLTLAVLANAAGPRPLRRREAPHRFGPSLGGI